MNEELTKKLETLELRISELESLLKKNLSMFGRSYSLIGDSNSDFLIKTKGLIKIQWGSKFIDLLKDGKINVESKFIYNTSSVGSKDGIYVVGDEVWLVANGTQINLIGEVGDTYVSFLDFLETNSDLKYQALTNIGFIYPSLDSISENSLKNGIIYVESEKKLYIINNGNIENFSIDFPNQFSKPFIISKSDDSKGSVIIKGQGIENSLAFDNFYIYSDNNNSIIESDSSIIFKIGDLNVLVISDLLSEFLNKLVASSIESKDATSTKGFKLYLLNGTSILEIDKIIIKQTLEFGNTIIGDLSDDETKKKYGIYTDNLNLGGDSIDNLPLCSDSLMKVLEDIDIDSLNYDKVLCTVGILRLINLELNNRILKLEEEINKLNNI